MCSDEDGTYNPGILGRCSNQLSYLAKAVYMYFNIPGIYFDIKVLDSGYYVKVILTKKSILLPSVEIPAVLGRFLLLW